MSEAHEPALDAPEELTVERGPIDVVLLFVVACLVSIGVLAVYNGSALKSYFLSDAGDDLFYFRKQAQGALGGLVAMMIASRIDYRVYQRRILLLVGGSLVLLSLTRVPGIATTVNGATRWIRLAGVTFQPAELVKLVAVAFLAASITKKGHAMTKFFESFFAHGLVFLPFIALLMAQPDFGSSIVICTMVGLMLFVGGSRVSYMFAFAASGGLLAYAAISTRSYRMERITAWLDPWADAQDTGYHLVNSFVALARGGLTGTGFGEGGGRLGYIPELYNDFVAASVGEEFGLVGMAALATLYIIFVWRGLVISREARDTFGAYLAFGLTMLIGIQAGINLCVVTGVLPTKGLTLPFVSYGRSSLVLLLFAVGVLLNIGQNNDDLHAERVAADAEAQRQAALREKDERANARRRERVIRQLEEREHA